MYENTYIRKSVFNHLRKIREDCPSFDEVYSELSKAPQLVLFGGAVRDILDGNIPRDYDFVVNCPSSSIERLLSGFDYGKNSFGGYKVDLPSVEIDVWSLEDTWAFRNKYFDAEIKNLKNSVFLNIDSILIELKDGNVYSDGYIDALSKNTLEIVFEENPLPTLCVLRALIFKHKKNMHISPSLNRYIQNWVRDTEKPVTEIYNMQIKHYKKELFSEKQLEVKINSVFEKRLA
jgi:hypothetical protein